MKSTEAPLSGQVSLRLKGLIVLTLPTAALAAALWAAAALGSQTEFAERSVEEAFRVRADVQRILTLLVNAETGVRGYLLTGKEPYLEPYWRAKPALGRARSDLAGLVPGGGPQVALGSIAGLIAKELELLEDQRSEAAGARSASAQAGLLDASNEVMDRLRTELGAMLRLESQQVEARLAQSRAKRRQLFAVMAGGSLIGLVGGVLASLLLSNGVVRRIRRLQENAQRLAHGRTLLPSPAGNDEIAQLGRNLEEAAGLLCHRSEELQESEQRFRRLFEDAPVAYHETDENDAISRVNDSECRLLGYSREELLGRKVWELLPPGQQEEESREQAGRAAKSGPGVAQFERQYVRKDGSIVYVEIHENPITDEQGLVVGRRSALLDITERKVGELAGRKVEQYAQELKAKNEQLARALQTAREATEIKNRFLANMSHELRTPLNGIIGFSELMYDGKVGQVSEIHQEFLGDILTSARHLLQLINDVLDLAKVESGRMEFRPERVDLNALVEEVRDILRPLADKKRVPIEFEPTSEVGEAFVDTARFKQVLYNYLSNGVKFTPQGGKVTVRLANEVRAEFRLEVEDTGIGIPAEDISRLFQDFQQLPNARRQEQGTGLGLALTKRIVEAQGGRVGVRSIPGTGSTFFAIFPRVFPSNPPKPSALPTETVVPEAPPLTRILLIEDEPKDRAWLSQILTKAGYSVQTASTGAEGLAKCQAQSFDAITLDLLLPDRSGWELLRDIRATAHNHKTPVIVVSLTGERESGAAFQIDNFLTKPVDATELVTALERVGAPPYGSQVVLVVDDDANTLKLMQATLTSFGYRALCAADGESGLRLAAREHPSAIILDLVMPVMDGFQFLEQYRCDPSSGHAPVFVWTNKDLTLEEFAQLEGLAQNVVLKRHANPRSILEQLSQYLPLPLTSAK